MAIFYFQIHEDQVVMSHSPLKTYTEYHKQRVLVSGQGPVAEIAKGLGFQKVMTIDEVLSVFPHFDMVDHKRRRDPVSFISYLLVICTSTVHFSIFVHRSETCILPFCQL